MRTTVILSLLTILALTVGCDSGGDADPLHGRAWGLETGYCATAIAFGIKERHGYEFINACALTDGTIGMQIEGGVYDLDGDMITAGATRGSCAWPSGSRWSATWRVSGENLTLSDSSGFVVYEPLPSGGGSTAGTFGCFENAGFTPMPVRDL